MHKVDVTLVQFSLGQYFGPQSTGDSNSDRMTILVSRVTAVCVRWTAGQPSLYLAAQKCTSHYGICSNHLLTRIALHCWYNKPLMRLCKATEAIFCYWKKRGSVTRVYSWRTSWDRRRTALHTFGQNEGRNFCSLSPSHEEKQLKQQSFVSDFIRQICEQRDYDSVVHSCLSEQAYRTVAGQRVIISSFTLAITLHTNRTIGILSYIPKTEGGNGWVGGGSRGKNGKRVEKWHSGEWQEREQSIILWNRTAWLPVVSQFGF